MFSNAHAALRCLQRPITSTSINLWPVPARRYSSPAPPGWWSLRSDQTTARYPNRIRKWHSDLRISTSIEARARLHGEPALHHGVASGVARADNPIVQTIYTADPAPLVYNGRVYLYTGHDEDGSTYFTMKEWRVWSSADMVNWTDHGSPMSLATFSWASADAWAGQAVYRNGKFYWYVPVTDRSTGRMAIGVGGLGQPHRAVPRRARPPAGRERRDRPDRLHRRRRAGVPVLGQPEPVVRAAERRHDLVLRQPDPDPADHRGVRHPHRRRQPPDPVRGGALGLQAQRPVLHRVRGEVLLGVHRLLDGARPDRAVDLPRDDHAHAGQQLHQPRRRHRLQRRLVLLLPQRRAAGRRRLHPLGRGGEVHLQRRRHDPDDQHDHDRRAAGRHAQSVRAPGGRDDRLGSPASRPSRPARAA